MITETQRNKLKNVIVKLTQLYSDCYVMKTGWTLTATRENCYMVTLDETTIKMFKDIVGEFNMIYIPSLKKLKENLVPKKDKELDEQMKKDLNMDDTQLKEYKNEYANKAILNDIFIITDEKVTSTVLSILDEHTKIINNTNTWSNFMLSNDIDKNSEMLRSVFKENKYVDFVPEDKNYPYIILSKNLLPLMSETNYTDVFYSIKKINNELYLLMIDFQFELFRVYMFYFYIPLNK